MSNIQASFASSDLPVLKTLPDLVTRRLATQADKTAFIFEDDSLTYRDMDEGANRVANGLIAWGVKPDERIGYLGKNSHHYYQLLMGVAKAGAVLCPINWRLAQPEIEYILGDFEPTVLLIGIEFIEMAPALKSAIKSIKHILPMEPNDGYNHHYASWRDSFPTTSTDITRDKGDDALQIYTSGTTGRPKGAVLSNRSLLTAYERFRHVPNPSWNVWSDSDISLIPMPCFHIGGTAWGLTGMAAGATGVVMRNFVPTDVLGYIDRYKISKLFLVPAAIQIVINQPQAQTVDFSQLKYIFYGASPMPLPLLERAIDVFGCGFAQFYGMTETSGTISALPPEDHDINGNQRMRSVGKALHGVEIAILDDDGRELAAGEIGEITTRSTMNMNGYWNLADATRSTLIDGGWLRTGDVGYLDVDGYLFLKDRKKDMIISGGENIYPAEVENALFDHPKISDAAVIGVPDPKWGETVKACVVMKPNEILSEADIIAWCQSKIARFKCPKSVEFIDVLPRNPSGKVLKRVLRDTYSQKD